MGQDGDEITDRQKGEELMILHKSTEHYAPHNH